MVCIFVLAVLAWTLWNNDSESPEVYLRETDDPEKDLTESDAGQAHLSSAQTTSESAVLGDTAQSESSPAAPYRYELTRFRQSENPLRNDPTNPSELSEEVALLADMNQPEQQAMNYLYILLNSMRGIANRGYYTTGVNLEVTNSLLGKNYQKVAYLPESHPRINDTGELIDKWETPYHFHFQSSQHMEIRSAGPDRQMYTDDDIIGVMQ